MKYRLQDLISYSPWLEKSCNNDISLDVLVITSSRFFFVDPFFNSLSLTQVAVNEVSFLFQFRNSLFILRGNEGDSFTVEYHDELQSSDFCFVLLKELAYLIQFQDVLIKILKFCVIVERLSWQELNYCKVYNHTEMI